jgi:hypothetical protein
MRLGDVLAEVRMEVNATPVRGEGEELLVATGVVQLVTDSRSHR